MTDAGTRKSASRRMCGSLIGGAALALALGLGLLATPDGARGQTRGSVHRVGVIHISGHHHVVVDGLRQGLRELGLEEGLTVPPSLRLQADQVLE
jgi:hypothetical protein